MGLTSSLYVGRSALSASQIALQVTGNNIANLATPGYSRQRVGLTALGDTQIQNGVFVGRGVQTDQVQRVLDPAVQQRLRAAISDSGFASVAQGTLSQVESLLGELSGNDLSSQLGALFDAFSTLADTPTSVELRGAAVEQGAAVSSFMQRMRSDLVNLRRQTDQQLADQVEAADGLIQEIADLNLAIINAEGGQGSANGLRDARDQLISELSVLMDVTVVPSPGNSGSVDVIVGSTPLVRGSTAESIEVRRREINGELRVDVVTTGTTPEVIDADGGTIGGLLAQREGTVQRVLDELDELSARLIHEVNVLHSQGRAASGLTDTTGWLAVNPADQTLALNDPTNATFSGLPINARNGTFTVVITDQTGNQTESVIEVDLDGIDNTGAAGFGDDTTMADIVAALDGVANLNAEITADGRLRVFTDAGFDVSFKDDSSEALAVFGINTFFQGTSAGDIAVREELEADPSLLVTGSGEGRNDTVLALAQLRDAPIGSIGGRTQLEQWGETTGRIGVETSAAITNFEALDTVRLNLEAQRAAVSGVSLDEESINLITFQQQYQGAARFISVVDELTQTLISIV
ncbi:MAG: flagellar hook-associated protein FlgK [Planctomycetota bacterium]